MNTQLTEYFKAFDDSGNLVAEECISIEQAYDKAQAYLEDKYSADVLCGIRRQHSFDYTVYIEQIKEDEDCEEQIIGTFQKTFTFEWEK